MRVSLSPAEVEIAVSDWLTRKMEIGYHGWTLCYPEHIDGCLEFEEKAAPPPTPPKVKP